MVRFEKKIQLLYEGRSQHQAIYQLGGNILRNVERWMQRWASRRRMLLGHWKTGPGHDACDASLTGGGNRGGKVRRTGQSPRRRVAIRPGQELCRE